MQIGQQRLAGSLSSTLASTLVSLWTSLTKESWKIKSLKDVKDVSFKEGSDLSECGALDRCTDCLYTLIEKLAQHRHNVLTVRKAGVTHYFLCWKLKLPKHKVLEYSSILPYTTCGCSDIFFHLLFPHVTLWQILGISGSITMSECEPVVRF